MHRFLLLALLALPATSMADERASSPMVVIADGVEKSIVTAAAAAPAAATPEEMIANYPKQAITEVGAHTMGQQTDVPPTPASPASPLPPANAASATTPANPNSPTPPANPVNKLWPRDTIATFIPPCTNLHVEYVAPCTCVITKLMVAMPHDEFLKKSEDGTIEQDERLKQIRLDCVTAPQKKD